MREESRPNFLLITTDQQRWDAQPEARGDLRDRLRGIRETEQDERGSYGTGLADG